MKIGGRTTHEYADMFPMMTSEDLGALVRSMRDHGFRDEDPIVLLGGKILDGRNRAKAAAIAGVEPVFQDFAGGDPLAFVIDRNLRRLQYDKSQLAMVALEIEAAEAKLAKERQGTRTDLPKHSGKSAGKSDTGRKHCGKSATTFQRAGKARERAAKAVGVSPRLVSDAKAVKAADPDLARRVTAGDVSVNAAMARVRPLRPRRARTSDPVETAVAKVKSACSPLSTDQLASVFAWFKTYAQKRTGS